MALVVEVRSRSEATLAILRFDPNATVSDLKKEFAKKCHVAPGRQRLTVATADPNNPYVLKESEQALSTIPFLGQSNIVTFKDLGPQVGWTTVFVVEYLGPLLLHSLFFHFPRLFYWDVPATFQHNIVQTVCYWLVVLHYAKRELETLFVHRFSAETMPLFNIFKNSAHYWLLGGAAIAYFLYHPLYTAPSYLLSDGGGASPILVLLATIFLLCEVGNGYSHLLLAGLRPRGTRTRGIPRGFLFEYVSCANYTCELGAWLAFVLLAHCLTAAVFFVVSFAQIYVWAVKKHVALRKEFPDYPRGRKVLVPFLL